MLAGTAGFHGGYHRIFDEYGNREREGNLTLGKMGLLRDLSDISQEDAMNAFGLLKKWKALDMHTKRKALQLVMPKAVMFEDHLDMYLGSIHNVPARADYLQRDKRSK